MLALLGSPFADIAQLAEHILGKDEVTRSNRVISSIKEARELAIVCGLRAFCFVIIILVLRQASL